MESSGLEKPPKIMNSMFTTNPHPKCHIHVFFLTLLGMVIPSLHWAGSASA